MDFKKRNACQIAEAVNRGELSARRLIEETLERCTALNSKLNTFISIAGSEALEQAAAVDEKIKSGRKLPLAGVPLAVKDDFCCSSLPTSFGSPSFEKYYSPYNASAVDKLLDAGAVVIGKTNLDDMSMGSTTATSHLGPARNPWLTDLLAGSAGSAALAAGQCLLALESDSGGALRHGASHCGVFGLRPTTGRVSRFGLNLFSSSFGQVGIAAVSGEDLRTALSLITGYDERDASTAVYRDYSSSPSAPTKEESPTVGYPASAIGLLDTGRREIFEQIRGKFTGEGFKVEELELSLLSEALRAYYVIAYAESSSNLSRFDGIRFGEAAHADNLDDLYFKSRGGTFGREARRRSVFGTYLLSKSGFETYYRQALKVWNLVRQEFAAVFEKCDYLFLPAVHEQPGPADEDGDFLSLYEKDIFTAPVSMAGLPVLCLPAGQVDDLPVGFQLIGRPFSEERLIKDGSKIVPEIQDPPDGAC